MVSANINRRGRNIKSWLLLLKAPIPAIFRAAVLPPDDLIIVDYAFKVNTDTEFIYLFYARQG
ncbi:hypothetical protein KKR94_p00400 (plasmid) [Klebsiella pneumoniae]|nr:hypothetical protein KKR94_p00400 [Klebsiella pneumoniae]